MSILPKIQLSQRHVVSVYFNKNVSMERKPEKNSAYFPANRMNLTKRLKKNHSARHIYTAYTAATALSYLLIASNISIIFMIAAIIIQQVCFGGWNLLLDSVMVEESSDDRICTVVSVNNLLINLSKALIVVALGIFMQFTGIRLIYVLLSAILSISIFFLYLKKILIRRYL